jgi:conjugal transfer pilus assembly protein TraB
MSEQTSERGSQVKRKQLIMLGGVTAIGAVLALGGTYLVTGNKTKGAEAQQAAIPVNIVSGGSAYSEREAWRQQLGSEMEAMQRDFDTMKGALTEQQRVEAERAKASVRERELEPPVRPNSESAQPAPAGPSTPVAGPGTSPAGAVSLPPPPARKGGAPVFSTGAFDPPVGAQATAPKGEVIASIVFDDPKAVAAKEQRTTDGESGGVNAKKDAGSYIPAGTFARVLILNGLDAPTGGQSQSNPGPVLLRVMDHAVLPNGFKVDLKDCIVTGSGDGDVASERARIRTDRLSCVDPKGGAIDIAVRGYVAGEDGKAGLRGRLVTKTGQMLSNALLASIGSGIGEAFKTGSESTQVNPLGGATTTTTPGDGFQRGFGTGTQKAFDMLARYYIQLAEKTFPIIEVDGGRMVDVVFTRGFTIEGR